MGIVCFCHLPANTWELQGKGNMCSANQQSLFMSLSNKKNVGGCRCMKTAKYYVEGQDGAI